MAHLPRRKVASLAFYLRDLGLGDKRFGFHGKMLKWDFRTMHAIKSLP